MIREAMKILECVPNISEGRDRRLIADIAAQVRRPAVKLVDLHSDPVHNRTVLTFLGDPEAVEEATLAVSARAVELIDMRRHRGVHPRIGAVDVIPLVPYRGLTMADAVASAHRVGQAFAEAQGIPVYFYGEAALQAERRDLPALRKGQYEGLAARLADPAWKPDAGPWAFNPKSGATAVGARTPLIALNVNLATDDLEIARQIARRVRESSGGLPAVRAMGVPLPTKGCVQVAMNLTEYRKTSIPRVVELIRLEATRHGVVVTECELVGLLPLEALEKVVAHYLPLPGFTQKKVIEAHLLPE